MKKKFIDSMGLFILIFRGIITGIFGFFTNLILDKYINNDKNKN